jgi:hypothetical protein
MPKQKQKGGIRNIGARKGEGSAPRPGHFNPRKVPVPLVRREDYLDFGADLNRHGKLSPPEFHHWNVQPVASRYTDCYPGRQFNYRIFR